MMMGRGWGGIAVVICLEMYERQWILPNQGATPSGCATPLDVALNLIYRPFRRPART